MLAGYAKVLGKAGTVSVVVNGKHSVSLRATVSDVREVWGRCDYLVTLVDAENDATFWTIAEAFRLAENVAA